MRRLVPALAVLGALGGWSCGSGPAATDPPSLNRVGEPRPEAARYLLRQLQQDAGGGLGMQKRDASPAGAAARRRVDEAVSRRATASERAVEIGDSVADVMDPRPAPGEESRDGAVRVERLEQLHAHIAQGQADDRGAIGR